MAEIAIDIRNISIYYRILNSISVQKSFFRKKVRSEVFEAVKNVSFAVENGRILGIVGKNGTGKSTLLRSIAGVFSPNTGVIDLKGHSVSLMALGVGFKENLTGRENIIVSHSIETLKELCDRVMWLHDGEMREIGDTNTVLEHYLKFMGNG